jgi:hypothetical protein
MAKAGRALAELEAAESAAAVPTQTIGRPFRGQEGKSISATTKEQPISTEARLCKKALHHARARAGEMY